MSGLAEERSDQGHHQGRSDDHGTSSSSVTGREQQTSEEGGIRGEEKVNKEDTSAGGQERRERGGVQRREEVVRDEDAKSREDDMNVEKQKKGEGRERGGDETSSNSTITQPHPTTQRERRASDVVRVFWHLIDGAWEEIPPDSSDRRGAWTGEKQREMDEELRKSHKYRWWSFRRLDLWYKGVW